MLASGAVTLLIIAAVWVGMNYIGLAARCENLKEKLDDAGNGHAEALAAAKKDVDDYRRWYETGQHELSATRAACDRARAEQRAYAAENPRNWMMLFDRSGHELIRITLAHSPNGYSGSGTCKLAGDGTHFTLSIDGDSFWGATEDGVGTALVTPANSDAWFRDLVQGRKYQVTNLKKQDVVDAATKQTPAHPAPVSAGHRRLILSDETPELQEANA